MDWSTAKLIRIEGSDTRISQNDLKALLDCYGIHEAGQRRWLLDLARQSRAADPWCEVRDLASPSLRRFWSFETSASAIRSYQPKIVPGLLQSEQYASTVLKHLMGATGHVASRLWHVRQWRQQLHEMKRPPDMSFILDEAVIRLRVGGPDVMRQQLMLLLELGQSPHITIQVMPFTSGIHCGMRLSRFVHLEFDDDGGNAIFLEGPDELLSEDPDQTDYYLDVFRQMQTVAASPTRSADLLREIIHT